MGEWMGGTRAAWAHVAGGTCGSGLEELVEPQELYHDL